MRGRILVVDDEENQREMVSGFLRKNGHKVMTAADGDRAVEVSRDKTFDVVVTDYRMKGTDGVGVLKAVKKDIARIITGDDACPGKRKPR